MRVGPRSGLREMLVQPGPNSAVEIQGVTPVGVVPEIRELISPANPISGPAVPTRGGQISRGQILVRKRIILPADPIKDKKIQMRTVQPTIAIRIHPNPHREKIPAKGSKKQKQEEEEELGKRR